VSKTKAILFGAILLGIGTVLVQEHRARTELSHDSRSLKAELQELTREVAALREERSGPSASRVQSATTSAAGEDQAAELARLRSELNQLREKTVQLEASTAAMSNIIASARGANAPFVYADSIRRKDYAFSGYGAPHSALQSMFWALSQADPRTYQASVTSETAEMFAAALKDFPEGVMPGGYKNGALYQASGYRVLEETPISNDETRLKVFLEGRQNLVLKLVFKRVGDEWKLARTEF